VAAAIHARNRCGSCNHIENLGKQPLEQSGKHRVNENDEENLQQACGFVPRIITGLAITPSCSHSGAMPTGPRKARPDDRLRIEPGNLEIPRRAIARLGFALTRAPE
jgi:hypothetical protein